LATTDLPKCNIKAFIDNDPLKITKMNENSKMLSETTWEGGGKLLINKQIYSPEILDGVTGTVAICSVMFAQEIETQIKSINKNLKIIMLK
jgi:hypothetical protein